MASMLTKLNRIIVFCAAILAIAAASSASSASSAVLNIRGGIVPQASENGGDYYEQFQLDYGSADKKRLAGSLRGFIRSGVVASMPESDPFFKWLNEHLEKGPEPISGRLKPFYVSFDNILLFC
jgi:hypothetical protein